MRTYDIIDDATGAVLRRDEVDDAMRPAMLHGQSARLVELDGEKLAKASRPVIGAGAPDAELQPVPVDLVTEQAAADARAAAKAERDAAKAAKSD